ncbi:amidohydrolase [Endozoicomonadaceae bacterium StTr2]
MICLRPALLLATSLMLSLGGTLSTASEPAETIVENARIYTSNPDQPWASAMAYSNGRIVAIGSSEDVKSLKGENTTVINGDNKFIMPGFVSSHIHPGVAALMNTGVQLIDAKSPDAVVLEVKEFAAANPQRKAILGFGWFPAIFGPDGPTAKQLDKAVSDRPVILIAGDAHSAWVNTKGLELLEITSSTPDPVPGVHYYKRDKDGNPTGWLVEAGAFWPALKKLGLGDKDNFIEAYETMLPMLSQVGITALFDAVIPVVGEGAFQALVEMDAEGELPLHYQASHFILDKKSAEIALSEFERLKSRYFSPRFKMQAIKISNDGTLEAGTAAVYRPYSGLGHSGSTLFSEKELETLIRPIDKKNIQVMVHAIGNRTAHETINVLEKLRKENRYGAARHVVTHLQFINDEDIQRLADARLIAQVSPPWAQNVNQSFSSWETMLGEDRAQQQMRFDTMFDRGLMVSMGSDFPASGVGFLESSPLYGIEVGMTRQRPGVETSMVLPGKDERLSLEELIQGYTINSAYQLGLDDQIGSLEVGKQADYIVLSQNLFETPARMIHTTYVVETVVGGEAVYQEMK